MMKFHSKKGAAMADTQALAEKIARKAARVLDPLRIEMAANAWTDEFRAIMYQAVADTAQALANEAKADDARSNHQHAVMSAARE
jgi:hypothetical protein